MSEMQSKELGKKGEDLALGYLKKNGYKILEKNFRTRFGEIDIIAQKRKTLVFIEVKTRTSTQFGTPIEGISSLKQSRIREIAQEYLIKKGIENQEVRFDFLGIDQSGKEIKIEHIPNAF